MSRHFQYVGISNEQSSALATVLADSIRARIRAGRDVNDNPAPQLSARYLKAKLRRGLKGVRDWIWTGGTLSALVPLADSQGRIVVGFNNPLAAQIAAINNARCEQFGVSPGDRAKAIAALDEIRGSLVRIAA